MSSRTKNMGLCLSARRLCAWLYLVQASHKKEFRDLLLVLLSFAVFLLKWFGIIHWLRAHEPVGHHVWGNELRSSSLFLRHTTTAIDAAKCECLSRAQWMINQTIANHTVCMHWAHTERVRHTSDSVFHGLKIHIVANVMGWKEKWNFANEINNRSIILARYWNVQQQTDSTPNIKNALVHTFCVQIANWWRSIDFVSFDFLFSFLIFEWR